MTEEIVGEATGQENIKQDEIKQEEIKDAGQDEVVKSDEIKKAYEKIINPNKARDEEQEPTAEVPPEPAITSDQVKEMMEKVSRIPELEKQLRDGGGRYGALKQQFEHLQQRINNPESQADSTKAKADVGKLLEKFRGEYEELADLLQPAFEGLAGGGIDKSEVNRILAEQRQAERKAEIDEAEGQLAEIHPDWKDVITSTAFAEWTATLPEISQARIRKSQDPFFAAEMLDKHKSWLKAKTEKPAPAAPLSQPSKRLANAVLPTNGTKPAPKGEVDAKAIQRAAYERVAGKRR